MKKIFSFFLFMPAILFLSRKDEPYIDWSQEKRLEWDDFKAAPVKNSDAAALTATHLGFSYSFVNNQVSYDIMCRFDKSKSWGLVKNDWILKHEQGHFDIAEIFARRLNKSVSEYLFNKKTFQKDLDNIYKKVIADKEAYQQEYDTGSDFSRSKKNQNEWLKIIAKELEDSKEWAGYN